MRKIFCFSNQKGGVGKTTTAVNLVTGLALRGHKVLLIDLDPQGNATSGFGIDKGTVEKSTYDVLIGRETIEASVIPTLVENLSILPAIPALTGAEIELIDAVGREFVLRSILQEAKLDFEYVFIDCPPSLNLLTLNAMTASEKVLIPLQCEYYALEGVGQLLNTIRLVKQRLNPALVIGGVVLTMADFRTNLTQQVIEEVRGHFKEKVFRAVIPRSVRLSEAPSFGKPIFLYDPTSRGATAYQALVEEFLEREGGPQKEGAPPSVVENVVTQPS